MVRKRELQNLVNKQEAKIRTLEQRCEDLVNVNQELQEMIPPLREELRQARVEAQTARSEPQDCYVVVTTSENGTKRAYGVYPDRNAAQTAKKRIERENGGLDVTSHKVTPG